MSLGGKQTTSIDPDLKAAALAQLDMARQVGQLGFVPYQGATVAGFQPSQIAAAQNLNAGLSAFGFAPSPALSGADLSPYAIYQEQLAKMAPGQRAFINSMFIDPMTGAMPTLRFGVPAKEQSTEKDGTAVSAGSDRTSDRMAVSAARRGTTSVNTPASYLPGGVNTRNPDNVINRVAAAASPKQGAPTADDRPMRRPTR